MILTLLCLGWLLACAMSVYHIHTVRLLTNRIAELRSDLAWERNRRAASLGPTNVGAFKIKSRWVSANN